MSLTHIWAYRHERHSALASRSDWLWLWAACVFYGIIFAGVAVNFPAGLTVALVWLGIFAIPLAVWLYRQHDHDAAPRRNWPRIIRQSSFLLSPGKALLLQYYLCSYVIAFVIIVVYMTIFGYRDRASAGISLK